MTERKRPARSHGRRSRASSARGDRRSSRDSCPDEGSARSQRNSVDLSSNRIGPEDGFIQRPTARLQKRQTESSEDSGYASPLQSPQESSTKLHLETRLSLNYRFASGSKAGSSYGIEVSPLTKEDRDWNQTSHAESQGAVAEDMMGSRTFTSPYISSTGVFPSSAKWPAHSDQLSDGTDVPASTNLLSAAQALEQQALSLRRLASNSDQESMDQTRRQTVTFPICNEMPPGLQDWAQMPFASYDDLALAYGGRVSRTGLTPLPVEFNSLWDVNPLLSSSLGLGSDTTSNMHASIVPNVMEGASEEWMNIPNLYGLSMGDGISGAGESEPSPPQPRNQDAGQSTPIYRPPPQHSYGQLHPWPE